LGIKEKTGQWPVFLHSGFGFAAAAQAVLAPDALLLIADSVSGTAEAIEVSLLPLNRADHLRFGQSASFNTFLLGDTANGLDMHGLPHQ
jgi:hypothetical protein